MTWFKPKKSIAVVSKAPCQWVITAANFISWGMPSMQIAKIPSKISFEFPKEKVLMKFEQYESSNVSMWDTGCGYWLVPASDHLITL